MLTRIKTNLPKDRHEELEGSYKASRFYREQVVQVLTKDIAQLYKEIENNDFDSPNWAMEQAHKLAQIKSIRKIMALFE